METLADCVRKDYPLLVDIKRSHGIDTVHDLIASYVVNLNDSLNVQRMGDDQIDELAELLYEEGFYLKITELSEFFRRVKKAKYGEYYGSLDCIKVMTDFGEFLRDRSEAMQRVEQEAKRKKREESMNRTDFAPPPESLKQLINSLEFEDHETP